MLLAFLISGFFPCHAQESPTVNPVPAVPPISTGAGTPVPVYNQPLVINSSENVELERLRIAEELGKSEREGLAFREETLKLQKKLASASLALALPGAVPSDYRTFLSAKEGDIEKSKQYYKLLESTLNDLTPENPYQPRGAAAGLNLKRAAGNLLKLEQFEEDDGICRTIRAHVAEFFGSRKDDQQRIRNIDRELAVLAQKKIDLERNHQMTYHVNQLSGRPSGSDDDRKIIMGRIDEVTAKVDELNREKLSLSHVTKEISRKLQFQQYIVELAFQQRYIHALIACGFYRGSPSRGDMSISKDAYPTDRKKQDADPSGVDFSKLNPSSFVPNVTIPVVSTISGMEVLLTDRIRDAIKERGSIENMLAEKQMSSAESLLVKMVMTAKYQPELNTIPYSSRQIILKYGKTVRSMSDALSAKDYKEMKSLSSEIERMSSDAGMKDLRQFATEHPKKALYLVRQAELALKAGDRKAATSLTDSAMARAPMDADVQHQIEELQGTFLTNKGLADELEKIVESGDYKTAFGRMNEFAPLAGSSSDSKLRDRFNALIEREKTVRSTLEKCDGFERRSSYPDSWISLCEVDPDVAEDSRLVSRKSGISGKCPSFVTAYTKATEHSQAGADSVALAWYLSALAEAPGNPDLVEKINELGAKVLKN